MSTYSSLSSAASSASLSSAARLSPTAVGRLICVALTSLSSTCTAYEALLVHLPTTLSGSWTLACVFTVSIVFPLFV